MKTKTVATKFSLWIHTETSCLKIFLLSCFLSIANGLTRLVNHPAMKTKE